MLVYEQISYIYELDILEKTDNLCYTIDIKKKEVETMVSKEMFLNQINEDLLNCRNAQKHGRYETAAFYRGCAQGMATAMYWASTITVNEYDKLNERIRRSITMEEE